VGLLIAHQCSGPHWQQFEISLLNQLATQVAIAIQQSELYQHLLQPATLDSDPDSESCRFDEYLNQEWRRMAREALCL